MQPRPHGILGVRKARSQSPTFGIASPHLDDFPTGKTNDVTDFAAREFPNDRKVFFVPYYQPRPSNELPSEREIREVIATHPTIDGFFYFGAAGAADKLTAVSRKMSELWHETGKLYMAPVTSFYRGLRGNYRIYESHGFQLMQDMWLAAIEGHADWVEIVTWNDWGESTYIAPLSDEATMPVLQTHHGKLPPHGAFGEASRYYIEWFKQGHPPKITQDSLYYFYRMHPSSLKGPADPPKERLEFPRGVSSLEDSVFVTVFLKEPATLKVTVGKTTSAFDLDSGVQNISVPMQPGTPRFELIRDGKTVIDHAGEQSISADDVSTNFNYFSGGVVAAPEKPLLQQP